MVFLCVLVCVGEKGRSGGFGFCWAAALLRFIEFIVFVLYGCGESNHIFFNPMVHFLFYFFLLRFLPSFWVCYNHIFRGK
jgi:hypothetical protein